MLQALKETDRLRSALLQSVSHDLRTPLTAITASASALRESVPEHERDALLGGIEHEARRLVRLVDNMLDLSRIEAGALHPRRTLMPVDELLYAAVDDAAAALDGQFVDVDGAAELPPVNVDETMIRQVLVNLLENASRADPDDAIGLYASNSGNDPAHLRRRSRPGRARGRAAAHLRALLPPAQEPRPPRGHRPRAGHQPRLRRGPRRQAARRADAPAAARRSSSSCRSRHEAAADPARRRRAGRAARAARRARGPGLRRRRPCSRARTRSRASRTAPSISCCSTSACRASTASR